MTEELKLHEDDFEVNPEIEEDDGLEWTLKDEIRYYIWKHPFAFCSFCLMTGAIIYKITSSIYKLIERRK